jgi:hypothetical protein
MISPEYHHILKLNKAKALCRSCSNAIAVPLNTITQAQLSSEQKNNASDGHRLNKKAVILCKAVIVPVINNIGWEMIDGITIDKWRLVYYPIMCECTNIQLSADENCTFFDAEQQVRRLERLDKTFLAFRHDIGERINFDPLAGMLTLP